MERTFRNVQLLGAASLVDVRVADGVFMSVSPSQSDHPFDPGRDVEIAGNLMLPRFADIHTHLDKAGLWPLYDYHSGTLREAIALFQRARDSFTFDSLAARMLDTVLRSIQMGVGHIRTHLDHGPTIDLALDALADVSAKVGHLVAIEAVLLCPPNLDEQDVSDIRRLVQQRGLMIGGAPHLSSSPRRNLEQLFAIASSSATGLDLHIDESDDANVRTLEIVCDLKEKYQFAGQVIVGHCTTLAAMPADDARRIMHRVKSLGIAVVTLPGSNLFLQGRNDAGLIRRGLTRVRELLDVGVTVAIASDNVRDPFHPFGREDLLHTALLASYGAHLSAVADLERIVHMITDVPAHLMGANAYGIEAGNPADFVVCDTKSVAGLFAEQPVGREVWKSGEQIVTSHFRTEWSVPVPGRGV